MLRALVQMLNDSTAATAAWVWGWLWHAADGLHLRFPSTHIAGGLAAACPLGVFGLTLTLPYVQTTTPFHRGG
jgi:hypothetical protein